MGKFSTLVFCVIIGFSSNLHSQEKKINGIPDHLYGALKNIQEVNTDIKDYTSVAPDKLEKTKDGYIMHNGISVIKSDLYAEKIEIFVNGSFSKYYYRINTNIDLSVYTYSEYTTSEGIEFRFKVGNKLVSKEYHKYLE